MAQLLVSSSEPGRHGTPRAGRAFSQRGYGQRRVDRQRTRNGRTIGDEDAWVVAQLVAVVQGRGLRIVAYPTGRQRMHRVRAHHVVGPRRHAGKPVTFEDVAYVGVGQLPAAPGVRVRRVPDGPPTEHLLRDPHRVAGRRGRAEHALVVVLGHDEHGHPGLPAPQEKLLLLYAEPGRPGGVGHLREDRTQAGREVRLLKGVPAELRQPAVQPVPARHDGALADLVRLVRLAVGAAQPEQLPYLVLVDDGGVQPFAVAGEVPAHGWRQIGRAHV